MSEKIKEILDIIKKVSKREANSYNALIQTDSKKYKQLLDYITNLQQENKQLKEALLKIKEFIDKHTKIVKETGTKYLLTSVKDDNELINIINEILGDKENE